jgi:hypothetical protein
MRTLTALRSFTLALAIGATSAAPALTVVEPDGANDIAAAGPDYGAEVLGNPWDMSDAADVEAQQSGGLGNESISGGRYNAESISIDPGFFLLFQGVANTVNLSRGEAFPIQTSVYRNLTMKIRLTQAGGTSIGAQQGMMVFFYENGASTGNGRFGFSDFRAVNTGSWQIVNIDLATFTRPESPFDWTDFPTVRGLRIDPGTQSGIRVEVDWARLTTAAAGSTYNVTWTDTTSGSYTISALDGDGAEFILATSVTGTSANVSLARLAPGTYTIRLRRGTTFDDSPGQVRVNAPPEIRITAPNERGDTSRDFATVERGNPWGPFDAADIGSTGSIVNLAFDQPPGSGSISGRPTDGDPGIVLNTVGTPIDAVKYRSLCFTHQNFIPPPPAGTSGIASLVRVFWGNDLVNKTATRDIFMLFGLNEYCIPDLATVAVEPNPPVAWAGSLAFFRFDPSEDPPSAQCASAPSPLNCRDFRTDRITLSPFFRTNPNFNFQWNLIDADPGASSALTIQLDPDRNPGSGNEVLVTNIASVASGAGQFPWTPPGAIAAGTYNVRLIANDGRNTIGRYAGGPLVVGAEQTVGLTVTAPAADTTLPAAADYGRDVLSNRYDMSDPADINVARSFSVASQAYANGKYSATTTSGDPALLLVHPLDDAPIPTGTYRNLTIKMRLTGAGTHFAQTFWFTDPGFSAGSVGFTIGKVVPAGSWQIVSFDLVADKEPSAPNAWTAVANMPSLRFDPTTVNGAQVEIDWVTLTGSTNAGAQYTIQWQPTNLPTSTYDVALVDADGTEIIVANGLAAGTTSVGFNPSRFGPDAYNVRVRATPGPTTVSTARLVVGDVPTVSPFNILTNGFE